MEVDSDEVFILGVDEKMDCVCLGKRDKKVAADPDCIEVNDKGKQPANPNKRVKRKRALNSGSVIVIGDSEDSDTLKPDSLDFDTILPAIPVLTPCKFSSLKTDTDSIELDSVGRQTSASDVKPLDTSTLLSGDLLLGGPMSQPPTGLHTSVTKPVTAVMTPTTINIQPYNNQCTSSTATTQSSPATAVSVSHTINPNDTPLNQTLIQPSTLTEDEKLARELQDEEYARVTPIHQLNSDALMARELMLREVYTLPNPHKSLTPSSSAPEPSIIKPEMTTFSSSIKTEPSNSHTTQTSKDSSSTLTLSTLSASNGVDRMPTCWSPCPNCLPSYKRRYHIIEVAHGSSEWKVVTDPLTNANFTVVKVKRIQNDSLWQRLCYEKQLMLREREDVNMQLLYHTSRAETSVICEEGLDLRLSRNGMFGNGIYFSDNPEKCNSYWTPCANGGPRKMFVCRVLLGQIKYYAADQFDRNLKREPPKAAPKPGEPKTYDSVKGTIRGLNEFIVYNAYRVMPEYIIEYNTQPTAINGYPQASFTTPNLLLHNMALTAQHLAARQNPLVTRRQQSRRGKSRRKT